VIDCDKVKGGVSRMSHESFWYACYKQSYQKGKVWRPICFYSICNSNEEIFVDVANELIVL